MLTWKPNHYMASRQACSLADLKILEGGGRQFISPRPHLSQMHTTIYMPFTRKKAAFWKK